MGQAIYYSCPTYATGTIGMSYEFSQMSETAISEFLATPRNAVLATNRSDGAPQLTAVWYLYEGGKIFISVFKDSVKYRNMVKDNRVSLCVAGQHPDARGVTITGTAELLQDGSEQWIDETVFRLFRNYHDTDEEAQAYIDAEGGRDKSALVVITPTRVLAQDYNT